MRSDEPVSLPPPDTAGAEEPAERGRLRALLRGALAGAVLIGIAVAIVLLRSHGSASSAARSGTGPLDHRSPALNQPAPNFALRDMNGRLVRLSDLRGQVVLVNFWATWCGPCKQEMPAIEQVYREEQGRGFTVLEVDDQESMSDVAAFAHQLGELPPILLDSSGSVVAQYALKGLPDSFFLDRQGIVRVVSYGPMTRQSILKNIESIDQTAP